MLSFEAGKTYIINDKDKAIVVILDSESLHNFIVSKVSREVSNLVEYCYYPRVSDIYKELLFKCNTDEEKIKTYSTQTFKNPNWRLLHDPQTILMVLITQDFLRKKDRTGALSTLNLMSLRYYTNLMYRYIKYCNKDYFRTALERLSHNHLYTTKKTIGTSILYLSQQIFTKYEKDLSNNNIEAIVKMIYELRTRFNQSMKSFMNKYYEVSKTKDTTTSKEAEEKASEDQTLQSKLQQFASEVSKDICVYKSFDESSSKEAAMYSQFNKELSKAYAKQLTNLKYLDELEMAVFLFISSIGSLTTNSKTKFLEHSKRLMSVKVTSKKVYFKDSVTKIHDQIISELNLTQTFNSKSVQTQRLSRLCLSFYIALMIFKHFEQ